MELQPLTAISPIDGRYRKQSEHLGKYFSEFALIKQRVVVEVEYFFFLAEKKFFVLPSKAKNYLQRLVDNFSLSDAQKIKKIEAITNHDVKAVEYFLKDELEKASSAQRQPRARSTSQGGALSALPLRLGHKEPLNLLI